MLGLCVLGSLRVFLFSAAFPFFNNVDEQAHFDLVYKYSLGRLPKAAVEPFDRRAAELIVLHGSPEYLRDPQLGPAPPPRWDGGHASGSPGFEREVAAWISDKNHECGSFPSYYVLAGSWCALGRWIGLSGGQLLYWVRFLNVPLFAVLVWLTWRVARTLYPDDHLPRIALPLLIAFFPQDLFYAINSDSISPVLYAWLFWLLLRCNCEKRAHAHYLLAGLVAAAAVLTKLSNVTVLAFLLVFLLFQFRRAKDPTDGRLSRNAVLLAAMAVPVGLWLARNSIVMGDMTASIEKMKILGWTRKPIEQLWNHPIRTPSGLFYFLGRLTETFWRGEFVWYRERIASTGLDVFYLISTGFLLFLALVGAFAHRASLSSNLRLALSMSFGVIVASVLLLAVLSALFDFGACFYPSRARPYFVSGRLIAGALVPFCIVFITGLKEFFSIWSRPAHVLLAIVLIVIVITAGEVALSIDVFSSPYNWFALMSS